MKHFKKRKFDSFGRLTDEIRFFIRNWGRTRKIVKENWIPPEFRERLLLAVIGVTGCRYCSQFHARHALTVGLSKEEVEELLKHVVDSCPDEEAIAILYAQHWAESNSNPDPKAKRRMIETYGRKKTEIIDTLVKMMLIANLLGNTWDYFLYRFLSQRSDQDLHWDGV